MKTTIALFALTLSFNSFAYSITDASILTTASPVLTSATTSGGVEKAQAQVLMNDVQSYIQSGKVSLFLGQKIQEIAAQNDSVSTDEAVEILIEKAELILN